MTGGCKVLPVPSTNKAKTKSNTMKKNTIIALLLAFSSFTWFSCQTEEMVDPVEDKVAPYTAWSEANNSLFWRIEGNGLEQPAHLFGTIHLIPENDFSFEKELDSLLEISTSLMLEMDISDPQIVAAAQKRMVYAQGEGPEDYFTPEELEKIKALCTAVGTPWQSVKHLNLLSLEGYLSTQILQRDMGKLNGYEEHLVAEAKQVGTPVAGAEDADYVYSYHDVIPGEEIAKRLLEVSDKYSTDKEAYLGEFNQMVQMYLAQDLHQLHTTSFKEDTDPTYQGLVVDRNLAWMDALEKDLDGKFIAVGAGHLGGEHGLVHILKAQGYEVTALKIAR